MNSLIREKDVEKVLKSKYRGKSIEYLVKYNNNKSSFQYKWIKKEEFENEQLINDYYINKEKKRNIPTKGCPYNIIGMKKNEEEGHIILFVEKISTGEKVELPAAVFKEEYPQDLINFYESHTQFWFFIPKYEKKVSF